MSHPAKQIIVHVINSLGVGGAEVLLTNTIKLLPEYEHILVTMHLPHDQLGELQAFIKTHYCLNVAGKAQWPGAIWRLRKIIKTHKPTLVHAHLQIAGILTKVACPRSVPLFYNLHSPYSVDAFKSNPMAIVLERLTARTYHHLIGVSKVALCDYQSFVPKSGTGDVLYNMVGNAFFEAREPQKYIAGTPLKCVSIGNIKAAKNYIYTIKAFALLKDLPITLDICGGLLEFTLVAEIEAFIAENDVKNISFLGKCNSIDTILPNYNAYIISSSFEGFGIAPLEAMAVGLPVFASDIPVFREIASNTICYFDLNNPATLANHLRDAFTGQILLSDFAKQGQNQARKIGTSAIYKQNLIEIYKKYSSL